MKLMPYRYFYLPGLVPFYLSAMVHSTTAMLQRIILQKLWE